MEEYLFQRQQRGVFHHSSFLGGNPVTIGGEIIIKNGELVYADNFSGHYKPDESTLKLLQQELKKRGLNLDPAIFVKRIE